MLALSPGTFLRAEQHHLLPPPRDVLPQFPQMTGLLYEPVRLKADDRFPNTQPFQNCDKPLNEFLVCVVFAVFDQCGEFPEGISLGGGICPPLVR